MTEPTRPAPVAHRRPALLWRFIVWLPWNVILLLALYAVARFLPDEAVTYTDPVQHFKYGSTGGERESGFPYWIWQALPQVCPEYLPGKGYASVGMIYEAGKDLPVGVSRRRN